MFFVLSACLAGRADAQPCPGISADTAQRLFNRVKAVPAASGYRFDGVGTNQSELVVQWSLDGKQCPPIRVTVEDCGPTEQAVLQLHVPPELSARCPGLQAVVREISSAVAAERPVAREPLPPPPTSSFAAVIIVAVVFSLVILRLALLFGQRGASKPRRYAVALLQCVAIIGSAEIAYRVVIRGMGEQDGLRGNVFVLYSVGESTMVGEPFDDQLSLPGLVSEMLGRYIHGRPIVIRNLAQRGAGAQAQSLRFEREMAHRDRAVPAVVLIYAGHNEPYLKGADDGASPPPASWRAFPLVPPLRGRIIEHCWLLQDAYFSLRSLHFLQPSHGMHPYERSLRDIIETAQHAGVIPVLITLPSNISGVEPNAYAKETPGIAAILERGNALEKAGDFNAALQYYREQYAAGGGGQPAALLVLYRIAHCEQALGQTDAARGDFWTVVDEDPRLNFGRATLAQNELLRRLAAEYDLPLVDAVAAFAQASPHGILGDDLFSDGHHPTLRGYWFLAKACAGRLAESGFGELTDRLATPDALLTSFGLGAAELSRAHIGSGSWLIATAVYHPWPADRLALAEAHFRAAVGGSDDLSAWLGVALSQAGRRGGFLRIDENIDLLGRTQVYYNKRLPIPSSYRENLLDQFRRSAVDAAVVQRLEDLWH